MAKTKKVKFKESIGLDIGEHSIKMVHLKKLHQGFSLINCESRSTIAEGVEPIHSDLSPDRFAPVLSSMLKTMKIKPKKIKRLISSIGGENTSIKQIKTIFLPDDELESALFFEAKKHLPISGSEMMLDYQVRKVEEKSNNMHILLASATRELVNNHTDILTSAGIIPGIIDLEALGVANSFTLNNPVEDGVYILLDIGAFQSNMVVFGPDSKFFARNIDWGGFNFTKDIMKTNNLDYHEAEDYKFEHGLKKDDEKDGKESLIALDITEKTTAELMVQEIKRSLRFYVKEAGNSDFRKVFLFGGGAKLIGLSEYLTENLNIPTEVFNPFMSLEKPAKFSDETDPEFALAIGLALRPE
jgi:type IV pilus assembly protein PilM